MDNAANSDENDLRTPCRYGSECYQRNKQHLDKYKHPPKEEKKTPDPKKTRLNSGSLKQQKLNAFFKKPDKKKTEDKESFKNTSSSAEHVAENENQSNIRAGNNTNEISTEITTEAATSNDFRNHDYQEIIKKLFLVEMPPDFFSFWQFCKSLFSENPSKALEPTDLLLVGPFDVLAGILSMNFESEDVLRHWRYYYDPPEFQTVLKSNKSDLFHIGYYRDDPKELPVFVGYNYASKNPTITPIGENLFAALNWCMKHCESSGTPFKKVKFSNIKNELQQWAADHNFQLDNYTENMRKRDKRVVAKTFHHAGIVVPYDKKTELGYRPLSESTTNLMKIMKQMDYAKNEEERTACLSKLHEIINWANIAIDEGDYGTGLELGINLFCFGSKYFHSMIIQLLSTVYKLLDRETFATILKVS